MQVISLFEQHNIKQIQEIQLGWQKKLHLNQEQLKLNANNECQTLLNNDKQLDKLCEVVKTVPEITKQFQEGFIQDVDSMNLVPNMEQDLEDKLLLDSAKKIKALLDAPEQIWHSIEKNLYYDASKIYQQNSLYYNELKDIFLNNNTTSILDVFPVIKIQYDILNNAKESILDRGKIQLYNFELDKQILLQIFKSIQLLQCKTIDKIIIDNFDIKINGLKNLFGKNDLIYNIKKLINCIEIHLKCLIYVLVIFGNHFISFKSCMTIHNNLKQVINLSELKYINNNKDNIINLEWSDLKQLIYNWYDKILQELDSLNLMDKLNDMEELVKFKTFFKDLDVEAPTLATFIPEFKTIMLDKFGIPIFSKALKNSLNTFNIQHQRIIEQVISKIQKDKLDIEPSNNNWFDLKSIYINEDVINLNSKLDTHLNQIELNTFYTDFINIQNNLDLYFEKFNTLFNHPNIIFKNLDHLALDEFFEVYFNMFYYFFDQLETILNNSNVDNYERDIFISKLINKLSQQYFEMNKNKLLALKYYHLDKEHEHNLSLLLQRKQHMINSSYKTGLEYFIQNYTQLLYKNWYSIPTFNNVNIIPAQFSEVDVVHSSCGYLPTMISNNLLKVLKQVANFILKLDLESNEEMKIQVYKGLLQTILDKIKDNKQTHLINTKDKLDINQLQFIFDSLALFVLFQSTLDIQKLIEFFNSIDFNSNLLDKGFISKLLELVKSALIHFKMILYPLIYLSDDKELLSLKCNPTSNIVDVAPPCKRFIMLE